MNDQVKQALREEMEEQDIDVNQHSRQDAGWFRLYVECPDCQSPFIRVQTESKSGALGPDSDISETEMVGICPDCHAKKVTLKIEKLITPV